MTRHKRRSAALLLAMGFAHVPLSLSAQQPALGCEVADFSMTLRLYMPLAPDGTGSPGQAGMEGSIEIHHQKVPKDQRVWSLDGKRPAQFWNRDGHLKLLLLLGSTQDPIILVIEAQQRDQQGEHAGSFRLVASGARLTGRISCTAG